MKVKIDGQLYDMPERRLPMGEQLLLKREYGYAAARDGMNFDDPSHVAAFVFMTLRQRLPDALPNMLIDQISRVVEVDFVSDDGSPLSGEEAQEATDPTPPPSEGEKSSSAKPEKASK